MPASTEVFVILHKNRSPRLDADLDQQRRDQARGVAGEGNCKLRMAAFLAGGGFEAEPPKPAAQG